MSIYKGIPDGYVVIKEEPKILYLGVKFSEMGGEAPGHILYDGVLFKHDGASFMKNEWPTTFICIKEYHRVEHKAKENPLLPKCTNEDGHRLGINQVGGQFMYEADVTDKTKESFHKFNYCPDCGQELKSSYWIKMTDAEEATEAGIRG